MYINDNCIKLLLLQLIIEANVATSWAVETATNIISKLLPSTTATVSNTNMDEKTFVQFLKCLNRNQHFTTIVILTNWTNNNRTQRDYCVNLKYYMEYEDQQGRTGAYSPLILLKSQQQDYLLHSKFDSDFLTLICIAPILNSSFSSSYQIIQKQLLSALSKNLWYLRQNRVIVRVYFSRYPEDKTLQIIADIFLYCHMEQILNVIVISYQFPHSDLEYYSYTKFPKFQIRKQKWISGETQLFPDQLRDIKGYTLHTIPDQIEPRSILYYDKNHQPQMFGYMGHFVRYFAKSINATLKFAFDVKEDQVIFYSDILNLTRNNTIDLAASLVGPANGTDWSEFSYTHEIASFCVMLPVESDLSSGEIFLAVMNSYFITILILLCVCFNFLLLVVFKRISGPLYRFYWVDLLLNDKSFRAVLGQSFPFRNRQLDYFVAYVFFLLFLTSVMVVILYGVFLGSYMTSPPKKPLIKNFDDLDKSSIKILISPEEYNLTYPPDYQRYHNLFEIVPISETYEQRRLLNTSYAYVLSLSRWHTLAEQQKHFSRPLFRYSTDLCFWSFLPLSQFLPLHSLFREPLHFATLNVYESGLFNYWFEMAFYEMVYVGRMSFADLAEPREVKPLAVLDLKIVFVGFYISLLGSVGIFFAELFVYRQK